MTLSPGSAEFLSDSSSPGCEPKSQSGTLTSINGFIDLVWTGRLFRKMKQFLSLGPGALDDVDDYEVAADNTR